MKKIIGLFLVLSLFLNSLNTLGEDFKKTVIVLGSEPECIAAAVKASTLGYKVTLLTSESELGGLFVTGMLTVLDINYDTQNQVLHQGFFQMLLAHCSNGANLDFKQTQAFFEKIIANNDIRVLYQASDLIPIVHEDQVIGVSYTKDSVVHSIYSDFIVDGSPEAAFTRKLGVPYRKGRSEWNMPNTYAAATLVFSVKGANWSLISEHLKTDGSSSTGAYHNTAWGFNQMYAYPASHPRLQMRGLNLSRQNDGSIVLNALLIFDVDPSEKKSIDTAYTLATNELPLIIDYLSKHCVGFENAALDQVAQSLYIREGVRIVGADTLTANDIFEHTSFPNTIAYGSYPIDLQATKQGQYGCALCCKSMYSIPLGCMLPKNFHNLLVIGRSASFDIIAHGSARTVPVLIAMAENGVVAMDFSHTHHISATLLNHSLEHLAFLYPVLQKESHFKRLKLPTPTLTANWYYPYIHHLRSEGLFSTGYTPYDLESTTHTKEALMSTLTLLSDHTTYVLPLPCKNFVHSLQMPITQKNLCTFFSYLLNEDFTSLEMLYEQGKIDRLTYTHTKDIEPLTPSATYALLDNLFKVILPSHPLIRYQDPPDFINE